MNIKVLAFYMNLCKSANVIPNFKDLIEVNRVWKDEFKIGGCMNE